MPSSRKKQRTASQANGSRAMKPLGARSAPKTHGNGAGAGQPPSQEEMRLAASLFGNDASTAEDYNVASSAPRAGTGFDDQPAFTMDYTGLEDVDDEQLFTVDGAYGSDDDHDDDDRSDDDETDITSASEDDGEMDVEYRTADDFAQPGESPTISSPSIDDSLKQSSSSSLAADNRPKPVWSDPSTASMLVPLVGPGARAADGSFAGTKRLRKLRTSKDETEVTGREYERRLREMYEKLHPRPAWASRTSAAPQQQQQQQQQPTQPSGNRVSLSSSSRTSLSDLLARDSGLVARVTGHRAKGRLPSGELEVERLRDANHGMDPDLASAIECMEFHPSPRAKILMTASRDRRVRLFQIDGNANPLLQTLHVPSLPVTTAQFHPMGSSILLSGPRPYLYSYDLQAGRVLRSSPWRAAASGASGPLSSHAEDFKDRDLSRAKFQPLDSAGQSRLLAIAGRRGAIHLLDWSSTGGSGGGSLITSLRQNAPLAGLDWDASPGADGRRLVTLSTEGTVSLWDVRNTRCEVVRRDPGLFGAQGLALSPDGAWCAVGSESGIVNMYDSASLAAGVGTGVGAGTAGPGEVLGLEACKSLGNLTTASTTLRFNPDGQILALASRNKKDALKVVHLPSLSVFSNWPTSGTPLGHVSDVAFSTHGSQYLAVGNTRGRVLLYGLRHFTS